MIIQISYQKGNKNMNKSKNKTKIKTTKITKKNELRAVWSSISINFNSLHQYMLEINCQVRN